MHNKKLAAAQKRYAQAQLQTQQCRQALAAGGSYVLYKLAIAEEDRALARLQALAA